MIYRESAYNPLLTGLFFANEKEALGWPLGVEFEFVLNRRATVGGNLLNKIKKYAIQIKEDVL